jgi:serine/threonine protein kinase
VRQRSAQFSHEAMSSEHTPTNPTMHRCTVCGSELPSGWPRALCRRCALKGALEPEGDLLVPDKAWPGAGRVIDGRFRLMEVLGAGGMAVVWLADDRELDQLVALKFLPSNLRSDPGVLAELRRETARSRRLCHPNIVRIYDFHHSQTDGPYISMEYARGESLQGLRLAKPGRRFAWEYLQPIVVQLCRTLQYAHSEQVIHRDIKPSNLIVDAQGRLKLADFGVATLVMDPAVRVSTSLHRTGTPQFMSPQQLSGLTPQPTDDFYSLGATLYDLLSGSPPFSGEDILRQIRETMPEPLRYRLRQLGLPHDVPRHVEALIVACLAKRPQRRPRTAQAIAEWIGPELRVRGIGSRLRGWFDRLRATSRPGGQS